MRTAPTDEQVDGFLRTFGAAGFRHAAEILPLLRSQRSDVEVTAAELPTLEALRDIYRARAEHLASRDVGPTYPSTLPADVAALADGLDAAEDQAIRMWHIQLVDGTVFVIFELLRTRALAGVVRPRTSASSISGGVPRTS